MKLIPEIGGNPLYFLDLIITIKDSQHRFEFEEIDLVIDIGILSAPFP